MKSIAFRKLSKTTASIFTITSHFNLSTNHGYSLDLPDLDSVIRLNFRSVQTFTLLFTRSSLLALNWVIRLNFKRLSNFFEQSSSLHFLLFVCTVLNGLPFPPNNVFFLFSQIWHHELPTIWRWGWRERHLCLCESWFLEQWCSCDEWHKYLLAWYWSIPDKDRRVCVQ